MPEISVDIESNRPVIAANLEELRYLVFYGMTGVDGKSAYELAVELGFEGTEQEWLDSLQGADGKNYGIVVDGSVDHILELKSEESPDGKSAYEIAVENGFDGTETEWLESLQGEDGKNYGIVVDGSVDEVLKLKSVPASGEGGPIIIDDAPTSGSQNAVSSGGVYTALAGKTDSSSLATVATTGSYNDLSDKPTIPASATVDATPTSGSGNAVSSGGVFTALAGKQNTLTFDSAPTENSENPVTSDGVYTALAAKQDTLTAGTGITIDSNNVISASGGGGSSGWVQLTSAVFEIFSNFTDATVEEYEAYYNADTGLVRLNLIVSGSGNSAGSVTSPTSFSLYFNDSKYYKPYYSGYYTAPPPYHACPIGLLSVLPSTYGIANACLLYDTGEAGSAYSAQRPHIEVAGAYSSRNYRVYISGFYYTEDIPTGGES